MNHHDLLQVATDIRDRARFFGDVDGEDMIEWAERIERGLGFTIGYGNTFTAGQASHNGKVAE